MTRTTGSVHARGFSLIEVMVAVVILSFGLLALSALQMSLIRSSADSKTQSIAVGLAKDKIESLRAFVSLSGTAPTYRSIDSEAAVTLSDVGGNLGGVNFTRSTTVTRYAFNKLAGTPAGSAPAYETITNTLTDAQIAALKSATTEYVPTRDFKRVRVNVTWTDQVGTSRTVSAEDIIDSIDPVDSARIAKSAVSGAGPRKIEQIIVDPGTIGGVIPVAIGDGKSTAASNPTPEVVGKDNDVVATKFSVYTYAALSGGKAQAQSVVETQVMHCTCSTAKKPADSKARGYRPSYWNGSRYVPPKLTTSVPPAGWMGAATESSRCDVCCRDHHDPSGVEGAKFDPWRSSHSHYSVNASTGALTLAESGQYDEACRLIRVDGIYRVAADLRNDYFALLETNNTGLITDPDHNARPYAPSSDVGLVKGGRTRYQNFILDYLDDRYSNNGSSSTYNTALATSAYEATYELNKPTTAIAIKSGVAANSADSKWLHSRGLYIDWLEAEAIAAITTARSNCSDKSTQDKRNTCVLPYVPFTSINLTELADWRVGTSVPQDTKSMVVANNAFYDPTNSNVPTRGNVSTANATDPKSGDKASIYTTLTESNAGVALFKHKIDADEVSGSDSQPFEVGSGSPPSGAVLFFVEVSGQSAAATPIIGDGASYTCAVNGSPNPYQCSLVPGADGKVQMRVTGYTKASTLTVPNGCKNNGTTSMPIINDYDVASASPNASIVSSSGEGSTADLTWIAYKPDVPPAAASMLTITFSGPQRYCPSNYNKQANGDSTGLNCGVAPAPNNTPLWSATYVVCPDGTP